MKIPPQAKKVFKGAIFDVYQWEQEMFDGSHSTFEMIKRPDTVQIIATQGDKIFIGLQEQPTKPQQFTFLGGRVDEGEEPLFAAQRELMEEAGLRSNDWELFKVYSAAGAKIDWNLYYFIARGCLKVAEQKLDSGERIEVRTFSFEEFIDFIINNALHHPQFSIDVMRLKLEPALWGQFRKKLFDS